MAKETFSFRVDLVIDFSAFPGESIQNAREEVYQDTIARLKRNLLLATASITKLT